MNILIPIYNPPAGWPSVLAGRLVDFQKVMQVPLHVILVDDGSERPLAEIWNAEWVEHDQIRIHWVRCARNQGKGSAIREGLAMVNDRATMITDVDMPFDQESMQRIAAALYAGYDVVLGERTAAYYRALPLSRRWLSLLFKYFSQFILGRKVGDTQAGLKGVSPKGAEAFGATTTKGFLADFEFVQRALKRGLRITKVPVELRDAIAFRPFGGGLIKRELTSFLALLLKKRE